MATFSFTISGAVIDQLTGDSGSSSQEFTFDRGLSRAPKFRVLTSKFGDGYSQRLGDGINTKEEEFSASFNTRLATEANLLAAYFDYLGGVSAFSITITNLNTDENIKVICEGYTLTYPYTSVHSINANFKRVYEP